MRAALSVTPAAWNPAWRWGNAVRASLGEDARIAIDPRAVEGKVSARIMTGLKARFLAPDLAACDVRSIPDLHTYRDIEDFAAHGDDHRATRLFQWLKQEAEKGSPINARGIVCDTEERMLGYYRTYLELFRSLQRQGYNYRGEDEICFGMTASGGIVHMRRGTHRLAAAHFLKLPFVTGYVTHADPMWVATCPVPEKGGPLEAIAVSLLALQTQAKAQ